MSLRDSDIELGSDYHVQESRIINHPAYSQPIIETRYGWANKNRPTAWYAQTVKIYED